MSPIAVLPAAVLLAFLGAPNDKPKTPTKPPAPAISCKLMTSEAPRGGRIEVEGHGFGRVPLVRIAGKVTRIIERRGDRISAQVPRDSDGGMVSVKAGQNEADCGKLTIIGKDRP